MKIEIGNQHLVLLHQKAVYWEEKKTLLIGDLHLGKISHFRKEGFALPQQAITTNFTRLDEVMSGYAVDRIIFLGDLFHSSYNAEWELFAAWRQKHRDTDMLIVLGNHDILPAGLFLENNIRVFAEDYREDGFMFTHHPLTRPDAGYFVFAAHIHPVFTLKGRGRQSLRLPCFFVSNNQMVLPCFGVFTGGHEVNYLQPEEVYVVSGNQVVKI